MISKLQKKDNKSEVDKTNNVCSIPDWQIELGKRELLNVANNTAELMEWGEAKKQFKI